MIYFLFLDNLSCIEINVSTLKNVFIDGSTYGALYILLFIYVICLVKKVFFFLILISDM